MAADGRYCCKSLFALVIKNSPGRRRDFRVKMWGTSSPDDKLTGDLGNVIEATQIGGRQSDRLMAGKLSPSNFGLLQQYLPASVIAIPFCPRDKRTDRNFRDPKFHYITFPPRYGSALRSGESHHGFDGEAAVSVVLNDLLLFSCLTALVTGIVVAAAALLI